MPGYFEMNQAWRAQQGSAPMDPNAPEEGTLALEDYDLEWEASQPQQSQSGRTPRSGHGSAQSAQGGTESQPSHVSQHDSQDSQLQFPLLAAEMEELAQAHVAFHAGADVASSRSPTLSAASTCVASPSGKGGGGGGNGKGKPGPGTWPMMFGARSGRSGPYGKGQ